MNFYDNLSKNVNTKKHRKTVVELGVPGSDDFTKNIGKLGLIAGQSRNGMTQGSKSGEEMLQEDSNMVVEEESTVRQDDTL